MLGNLAVRLGSEHCSRITSSSKQQKFQTKSKHSKPRLKVRVPSTQSHYREIPVWEIFMEQELRFGLDLGQMANFPAFIASKSFDL